LQASGDPLLAKEGIPRACNISKRFLIPYLVWACDLRPSGRPSPSPPFAVHPIIGPFVGNLLLTSPGLGDTQLMISLVFLALLAVSSSFEVRDVHGRPFKPFRVEEKAQILFFLSAECPISRFYAQEIQHICKEYGVRGVRCGLIYEDLPVNTAAIRAHLDEFGYRGIPAATDGTGRIAMRVDATVTPEAVVIDRAGQIRYRGRIDNFYVDLGKPRRTATVHDLRDALDAIIAGRVVTHPETTSVGCFIVSPDLFKEKK